MTIMIIVIDIDNNDNDAHQDRQPVASRTRFYRINRKWSQVDFKYFSNFQIFFKFSNICQIFRYFSNFQIFFKFSNIFQIFKYFSNFQIFFKFSNIFQIFKYFLIFQIIFKFSNIFKFFKYFLIFQIFFKYVYNLLHFLCIFRLASGLGYKMGSLRRSMSRSSLRYRTATFPRSPAKFSSMVNIR